MSKVKAAEEKVPDLPVYARADLSKVHSHPS